MVSKVFVCTYEGKTLTFELSDKPFQRISVLQLKESIQFLYGTPAGQQILIFLGKQLEDKRLLSDYGVKDGSVVHLAAKLWGELRRTLSCELCQVKRAVEAADEQQKVVVRITIGTLHGKEFTIELTDMQFLKTGVDDLKQMIENREKINVNDQRLMFRGFELKDDSLLSHYGIDDQSSVYVELPPRYSLMKLLESVSRTENQIKSVRIMIRTFKGMTFTIILPDERSTVLKLKLEIWFLAETPAHEQQLIFSGQQLEDNRLLSDYGVKDNSVIYMFLWDAFVNPSNKDAEMGDKRTQNQSEHDRTLPCKPHEGKSAKEATDQHHKVQKVLIQTLAWGKFPIDFSTRQLQEITVLHLKEEIQVLKGIPVHQQRLIFDCEQLKDEVLLSDYGVKNESVISLAQRRPDGRHKMFVRVYVKTLTGKTITINLSSRHFPSIEVLHLKQLIERLEGIPAHQQRIIFNGKQLDDNSLLSDCGIVNATTIDLLLSLRGGGVLPPVPEGIMRMQSRWRRQRRKRRKRRSYSMERLVGF